jgi:hypothetical protein
MTNLQWVRQSNLRFKHCNILIYNIGSGSVNLNLFL